METSESFHHLKTGEPERDCLNNEPSTFRIRITGTSRQVLPWIKAGLILKSGEVYSQPLCRWCARLSVHLQYVSRSLSLAFSSCYKYGCLINRVAFHSSTPKMDTKHIRLGFTAVKGWYHGISAGSGFRYKNITFSRFCDYISYLFVIHPLIHASSSNRLHIVYVWNQVITRSSILRAYSRPFSSLVTVKWPPFQQIHKAPWEELRRNSSNSSYPVECINSISEP